MNQKEVEDIEKEVYSRAFSRLPVTIVRGKGMYLYDLNNNKFLDMFSGIAVCSLGHSNEEIIKVIANQSKKLMHVSNWFYTLPQLELARLLTRISGLKRVFITNDGTGAVESAIKLARKVTGKKEIIAMENAFHGRTLGSLSLTWNEKYKKPFYPLLPRVKFARYNDIESLKKLISEDTAAVILEPIQGESGVIIPGDDYLREVREITEERDVLLILDEIQTGFGRTGVMFEFQRHRIKPDILCVGKGMAAGFPIGAIVYNCGDFDKGEHGGTFVGNPLACEVAKKTIEIIQRENLIKNSDKIGNYIINELQDMEIRGRGLMIGIKVSDAKKTTLELIDRRILTIYSNNILRILPPLIIEKKHAEIFISAIDSLKC